MNPVVAVAAGAWLLSEPVSVSLFGALALVLAGTVISLNAARAPRAQLAGSKVCCCSVAPASSV